MFRLVEYYRTGGPITLSAKFWSVESAIAVAERLVDHLHAERPARCPYQLVVVDGATGEIVTRVRPHLDSDWDPDPFGHTEPGAPPTPIEGPANHPSCAWGHPAPAAEALSPFADPPPAGGKP